MASMPVIELAPRERPFELPSYSLTGDVLSFLRCELQYRYNGIGKLPPSDAVQHWFGRFIHGCMEEAFRRIQQGLRDDKPEEEVHPPWDPAVVEEIIEAVAARLKYEGVAAWNAKSYETGRRRAHAAINELGPYLFPLISHAEVRIRGTRPLEVIEPGAPDRYEVTGVVDVITHVELADARWARNPIVQAVRDALPTDPPPLFEVIVDYKGQRRPATSGGADGYDPWTSYGQQLQTYAHLRGSRPGNPPVVAGVLVYLNELAPSKRDLDELWKDLQGTDGRATDVPFEKGTPEFESLKRLRRGRWTDGDRPEDVLPFESRLRRALRVLPVDTDSVDDALTAFDGAAAEIERRRRAEANSGRLLDVWDTRYDQATCDRCDARSFCPSYPDEDAPKMPSA